MTKSLNFAARLHERVPPDWYETSVKVNFLQRYWHGRRFAAVRKFSEHVPGDVLDIGSADGYFSQEIQRLTTCKRLVGIDVLKTSVDYAAGRYKANKKMSFSLGDGHKLNFKNDLFDAIYCLEAMEHVENPAKVLREIYRVLKPTGYTLILVPAENLLFKMVWFFWTKWRGRIWQDTHLQHFDHTKLQELMHQANFKHIQSRKFLLGMLLLIKARK